jgi:hypothetical protein
MQTFQKSVPIALLLLIAMPILSAQTTKTISRQSLLADPNILWVGEGQSTILLDASTHNFEDDQFLKTVGIEWGAACATIKLVDNAPLGSYPTNELIGSFMNKFLSPSFWQKTPVYEDPACTKQVANPKQKLTRIEKIFDPETFNITETTVAISPEAFKSYRIQHLVYFDQKTNAFGNLVTAIAPVYDDNGKKQALFWIRMENLPTSKNLQAPEITLAKRSTSNFIPAQLKTLKSTKSITQCLDLNMETIRKNPQVADVRKTTGNLEKLSLQETAKLGFYRDTIATFDPKTFVEVLSYVDGKIEAKDLQRIRFLQEWYWDETQQKLSTYSLFYAPVVERTDDNGNFLNRSPIFWKAAAR